jgi:predicted outer membrane protein
MKFSTRTALRVAALLALSGCATERAVASGSGANAASTKAQSPTPKQSVAIDQSTTVTGGTVSAVPKEWTDARILGYLAAASAADLEQSQAAKEHARDPRVARFASHLQMDDRVFSARERALIDRLGSDDSPARLGLDVERGGFLMRMSTAGPEAFDAVFVDAMEKQCAGTVQLIDESLMPAVESDDVRALLTEIRAGAESHRAIAHDLASTLRRPH